VKTEAKVALRQAVLRRRDALPEDERAALSESIIGRVLMLPAYQRSEVVLAYASFGSELRTDGFLERVLQDGKSLLLPRVERCGLRLYGVRDLTRDLVPGTWGIREPDPERRRVADPKTVDFALVPGVAFDRQGWRLGHGGGFYDRLLEGGISDRASSVAGAFELQVVHEIPTDPHDAPVDVVVTEKGTYPPAARRLAR
jgi:5-formyltetrahydrofolate cyclo-ligase